eukprot:2735259-Rhodomonas_salina.2
MISPPPANALAPTVSPWRSHAQEAAHTGSVVITTDASDELMLLSASVSPIRVSAVVTTPVYSTAASAAGCSLTPERSVAGSWAEAEAAAAAAIQSSEQPPTVAVCTAVTGSACSGRALRMRSVRK